MTDAERRGFIELLRSTAELFRRRFSEDAGKVYADVLDDVPFDRLKHALSRVAREAEQGVPFPLPRELRARAFDRVATTNPREAQQQSRRAWLAGGAPLDRAGMAAILRDVALRHGRLGKANRVGWMDGLARELEGGARETGGGVFAETIRQATVRTLFPLREPGEEG